MKSICIVIPCYNEAERFDIISFEKYYNETTNSFYFVNDGSTDNTIDLLNKIKGNNQRIEIIDNAINKGKAEAVRTGMLKAIQNNTFDYIGFWDADFATPLFEIDNMTKLIKPGMQILLGSRIKRLGANIKRNAARHYFGRIFSTIVTKLFALPIYDTQCGAKIFHTTTINHLFDEKFHSKWLFDLELFIRYRKNYGRESLKENCYEYPLSKWEEVKGSKIKMIEFFKVPFQIISLYKHYYNS